ncbi:MAG: xanthine dehydrogenase family protein subunit M [Deltaproteobacteria bacterium]|nr:xanthine dehydrogenase family protein subunit M [Deltaproteobacteria bacterium]MBW1934258.1 xanthine dehydrogenase family protein subunit M [Deltaproteobacteria bacterium]MBW1977835.1 xanthine dehydrogenase family protein subunit M [Deltaproteobacteria bacterium]MBW2044641.1 xanthine dehydrogenase family protein subunit M [Deltaproteobacteria bacterium]MBW2298977.1 xanthine dehydrogenase family protein subunit M [Deltaproteobacteria bacterium]
MKPFFKPKAYFRPGSLGKAVELLSNFGDRAKVLAGGTDLLVQKPSGAECLIDIADLGLEYIKEHENGVEIGAATTVRSIGVSGSLSSEPYLVLRDAACALGTPTIRNMATIGGNICNASPAADLPLALMVLGASLTIMGPAGKREVNIGEFFENIGGKNIQADELLLSINIPASRGRCGTSFQKLRHHQTSIDIAIVNVAARMTCEKQACVKASIALGAVAPTPIYARKAEALLGKKRPNAAIIQEAASAASEEVNPIDDVRGSKWYRKKMAAVLVRRALEESSRRCGIWPE